MTCSRIREAVDHPFPVPIRHATGVLGAIDRMVSRLEQPRDARSSPGNIARMALLGEALVAFVMLRKTRWGTLLALQRIWTILLSIASEKNDLDVRVPERVHLGESESFVVKTSLLWRCLRRHTASISLLVDRLHSGLPSTQTRRWLSYYLREIGDDAGALALAPAMVAPDGERQPDVHAARSTRGIPRSSVACGVAIVTMQDSAIFRRSIQSLMESDFSGPVVIVEQAASQGRTCEEVARHFGALYIKNELGVGAARALNLGIAALPPVDVVLHAHNDVLWSARWCNGLQDAWLRVGLNGKVVEINLGYVEFNFNHSQHLTVMREMFVAGEYDALVQLLQTLRESRLPLRGVEDSQIADRTQLFGLARDRWNDLPQYGLRMTGRHSVAGSFPLAVWREMNGFDEQLAFAVDVELHLHAVRTRRWNLWMNNDPLVHAGSSDTGLMEQAARDVLQRTVEGHFLEFPAKYGFGIDQFLFSFFAESEVLYHDEIVAAVNEGRFSDIDFVFDDFVDRLKRKGVPEARLRGW